MNRALEDAELLMQLRRGEGRAMAMLYDRYARLVFSLAVKILNDRAGAEEVVQEVFVKVWRRARDYDSARGKFSSWLTGITHNHAIDELRRRRVRPSAAQNDEEEAPDILDEGPPLFEIAVQSIEHRRIVDALNAIPLPQRRAIEMAYFEGYTQQEIADRLKEPLGTIKTRMRLGTQKLKGLLGEREHI
ncbi:MAG: sigma-70 family RNA polymerase sigma factor [Chloroflexi bacterium]|nr:sigma-70 family RNA polymerase sigma factor [Chloroflexota bacterium]